MDGWIKIYKKMLDNPIVSKDAEHIGVWTYLLIQASHLDTKATFQGKEITLHSGEIITNSVEIAEKLRISHCKSFRITSAFQNANMIEIHRSAQKCLYKIVNWESYQSTDAIHFATHNENQSQFICNSSCNSQPNPSSFIENKNNKIYKNIPPYPPKGEGKGKARPSKEEVAEYAKTIGGAEYYEAFYDYYTGTDWTAGGSPIGDWQALLRAWIKKNSKTYRKDDWDSSGGSFDTDEFFEAACRRSDELLKDDY